MKWMQLKHHWKVVSIMSDTCIVIKHMLERIKNGESVERVIPYDMSGFTDECVIEMVALYVKYGDESLPRYELGRKTLYDRRANINI